MDTFKSDTVNDPTTAPESIKKDMQKLEDIANNGAIPTVQMTPQDVPSSPKEGQIYYDKVTKKHRGWDGSTWHDLY